jgi:hypothetical protein
MPAVLALLQFTKSDSIGKRCLIQHSLVVIRFSHSNLAMPIALFILRRAGEMGVL